MGSWKDSFPLLQLGVWVALTSWHDRKTNCIMFPCVFLPCGSWGLFTWDIVGLHCDFFQCIYAVKIDPCCVPTRNITSSYWIWCLFWLFVLHVLHYVCLILDILYVFCWQKGFVVKIECKFLLNLALHEWKFHANFHSCIETFNKLAVVNKTCIKLAINFHLCSESLMNVWWKFPVNLSGVQVWVKFSPNLHQTFTWRSGSSKNLSFFWNLTSKKWKNPGKHTENCKMYALKLQNIEEKDIAANIHDMMWNCCTQTARRNVYSNYALKRQLKWKLSLPKTSSESLPKKIRREMF